MNSAELIREWPSWRKANAETVFRSEAWRVQTECAGSDASLVRGTEFSPLVALEIALDDDVNRLVIGENQEFSDLMRLGGRLDGLPAEVIIALVEKECGPLLQTIENVVGRTLRISGIAGAELDGLECFELTGASCPVRFALKTDATMVQHFGELKNLDVGHSAIRALERETVAEYAEIALLEGEVAALSAGDRLILPADAAQAWRTDQAEDDLVHVRAARPTFISFANFADDDLPEVPAPDELVLVRRGKVIATAVSAKLGLADAIRIVTVG